ncbi:putative quorum-sensing-regulated virulence factor [Kaistia hirudinis]
MTKSSTISKCPFGRYKGKNWSDIPTDYILWILSQYNSF